MAIDQNAQNNQYTTLELARSGCDTLQEELTKAKEARTAILASFVKASPQQYQQFIKVTQFGRSILTSAMSDHLSFRNLKSAIKNGPEIFTRTSTYQTYSKLTSKGRGPTIPSRSSNYALEAYKI